MGILAAAGIGAVVGSFLNVCIARLPRGESVIRPASSCPACQAPIRWYDNIPLVSFALLRGACRTCRATISWQYPLVEGANAVAYAVLLMQFGFEWRTVIYAGLFSALLVVTVIDLYHYIIPDHITLPGIGIGLAWSAATAWPRGPVGMINGLVMEPGALSGALLGGWLFYIVAVVGRRLMGQEAMGGGDIKLIAMIGAFLGWRHVLLTIFVAALAGSVVGLGLMAFKGMSRKAHVPFGPFLSLGAVVALFWGPMIFEWYQKI